MTEPTIGEEGILAAVTALRELQIVRWKSDVTLESEARAAITAYLATQRAPDEELGRTVIDNRGIAWHLHDRRIAQPDYGGRCWFCPIATPPDDGTGQ